MAIPLKPKLSSMYRLPQRGSDQLPGSGLLRESDHTEVINRYGCFDLQLHIFRETAGFVELSDFRDLLHNRNVSQMSTTCDST